MRAFTFRPTDPIVTRDQDLRRWQATFDDVLAIADLAPRQRGTCVGIVKSIRLDPAEALEVVVEDGTGTMLARWPRRTEIGGIELGSGLRLEGTVAEDPDGTRRMLNPAWAPIREPYG